MRLAAEAVDQLAGRGFVDVGFDQVGEDVEQRRRHVARGRRRARAELLDEGLELGEFEVEAGGGELGIAECGLRIGRRCAGELASSTPSEHVDSLGASPLTDRFAKGIDAALERRRVARAR